MNRVRLVLEWALRLLVAAGLAIDCYVHADLAGTYDTNTAAISQGQLFRVEAALAACGALGVLVLRTRLGAAIAATVAAGGLVAVVVFRYVHVGAFGPFPDMYEPIWYPVKTLSAVAEGLTAALAAILVLTGRHRGANRRGGGADVSAAPTTWRRRRALGASRR